MNEHTVVPFVGKEKKENKKALTRILLSVALSGRSEPSVEEIHEYVHYAPEKAFELGELLVRLHGWSIQDACAFIKKFYSRP